MPAPLCQVTGRRKAAVARVRFVPGEGKVTVNRRPLEEYFSSVSNRMHATEPLRVAGRAENFDVIATIDGGGVAGQAGALRLGAGSRQKPQPAFQHDDSQQGIAVAVVQHGKAERHRIVPERKRSGDQEHRVNGQ